MPTSTEPTRCQWAHGGNALYLAYHDVEWGVPQHDDRILFEFLILEGAQAGLSWSTILNKRDGYRNAFASFAPSAVARFDEADIERCINDAGIVRNRAKIRSTVTNARHFIQLQEEFGTFDAYLWRFVDGEPVRNAWKSVTQIPTSTRVSDALSKDLKQRGFKFTGTTIMYAYMQAVGMVNDHAIDCFRWKEIDMQTGLTES